jgi:hypothetical protein
MLEDVHVISRNTRELTEHIVMLQCDATSTGMAPSEASHIAKTGHSNRSNRFGQGIFAVHSAQHGSSCTQIQQLLSVCTYHALARENTIATNTYNAQVKRPGRCTK